MKKTVAYLLLYAVMLPACCFADATLSILAPDAQIKTVGCIEGESWNLWSNGDLGDFIRFPAQGTYRVRVLCYGSPLGGVWPEMAFCVDGIIRETVTVNTSETKEFVFKLEAEAKNYRIAVSFLNDYMTETEDRNLYIVSLFLEPSDTGPGPALTTEQEWRTSWSSEQIKKENEILMMAAEAIEENRKSEATVRVLDKDGHPVTGADIFVELIRHDFLFGGNIYMFDRFGNRRKNELYKQRFRELFNYATTGFYWRSYEPERGEPDYAYTDRVVAWCSQNQIRLKGHPLLWDCEYDIPQWSQGQPPPEVQRQRIVDIMTRYAGKINFWEVVNEPAHLPDLEIDGPYRWAREANPEAHLIVNDYEVMANGYPPFFALLQRALDDGVPFDGVGIQAHEPRTMRFPLDRVWEILDLYSALGKKLHITEFTPTSGGQAITGSHITGKWDEDAQADYAVKFYTVCFAHPAVAAITWWDLCDEGSWLNGGGLIRKDMSPKQAYLALKKLIHEQWATKTGGKTDNNGDYFFRGFHGHYLATITQHGTVTRRPFYLGPGEQSTIGIVTSERSSNKTDAGDSQ